MLSPLRRAFVSGALTPWILAAAAIPALAPAYPDDPGLGTLARIVEHLAPQMILVALAGIALLAALRASKRVLLLTSAVCLAAAGTTAARHLSIAAPIQAERQADLTILWFNLLAENDTPAEHLAAALAASPADIVIVGEARPLLPVLALLAEVFPYSAGCETPRDCDMLALSRLPVTALSVDPTGRNQEERLATLRLGLPGHPEVTVLGLHLIKPWFLGFAERDDWYAYRAFERHPGPVVAVGDFNAAPWSRRVQGFARLCGFDLALRPRPTWPAQAAQLGVPIDHVMVRGGARLAGLTTWGHGLGSNHLGLLAEVAMPALAPPSPVPAGCVPPEDPDDAVRHWNAAEG